MDKNVQFWGIDVLSSKYVLYVASYTLYTLTFLMQTDSLHILLRKQFRFRLSSLWARDFAKKLQHKKYEDDELIFTKCKCALFCNHKIKAVTMQHAKLN